MFEKGYQPCSNFKGELNEFHLTNTHECVLCKNKESVVSWCENCRRDHHEFGYETCEHNGCFSKEICLKVLVKPEDHK